MTYPPARSARRVCLAVLAMPLWCGMAWAAPEATAGAGLALPLPGGDLPWWGYARALGVMFLVLGALWAVLWLLRRSGRFAGMSRAGSLPRDGLYLERQLGIGPRKGLVVVRFLNKRLLLGVTEHQITLLTEADPHDAPPPPDNTAFQRLLDAAGSCPGEAAPAPPHGADKPDTH